MLIEESRRRAGLVLLVVGYGGSCAPFVRLQYCSGFGIPTPPSTLPVPPRPVRPDNSLPIAPVHPTLPIYLPGGPDNSLPLPPGAVWPPLPPGLGASKVLCFVWIVGIGYRWTVIDPSLQPDNELPPTTVPPLEPPSAVPKTSATSPPPTPTPHR